MKSFFAEKFICKLKWNPDILGFLKNLLKFNGRFLIKFFKQKKTVGKIIDHSISFPSLNFSHILIQICSYSYSLNEQNGILSFLAFSLS